MPFSKQKIASVNLTNIYRVAVYQKNVHICNNTMQNDAHKCQTLLMEHSVYRNNITQSYTQSINLAS